MPEEVISTKESRSSTPRSSPSRAGSSTGGSGEASGSSSKPRPRKAPVGPEPPPRRAVAYVRESTEGQGGGFSPDAQREAMRRVVAEHTRAPARGYCDFRPAWRPADGRPQ